VRHLLAEMRRHNYFLLSSLAVIVKKTRVQSEINNVGWAMSTFFLGKVITDHRRAGYRNLPKILDVNDFQTVGTVHSTYTGVNKSYFFMLI
jgi:hypothetical protein